MLIEIDDSLISAFPITNASQSLLLTSIVSSAFYGEHFLIGSRSAMDWLIKQDIGDTLKSVCRKISNDIPQYRSLMNLIKFKVVIVADGEDIACRSEGVWEIPFGNLLEGHRISLSVLLSENISDSHIYIIAAEHYKEHIGAGNGVCINIDPRGGGGNQIYSEFESIVNTKRYFCLAITDTDKNRPNAESNSTSKRCKLIANKKIWVTGHADVPARELENIIPINLIEDLIVSESELKDLVNRFERIRLISENNFEIFLYSDLKKGTPYSWCKEEKTPKSKFWKKFIETKFANQHICDESCQAECKAKIIDPLSENIATSFLEYCKKNSKKKIYERAKTSKNANQWLEIGMYVFNWGIAAPRRRS